MFGYRKYTNFVNKSIDSYRFTVTVDLYKGHRLNIFYDYGSKSSKPCLVTSITSYDLSFFDKFLKMHYNLDIVLENLVEWY